jgi:hypothetical protein
MDRIEPGIANQTLGRLASIGIGREQGSRRYRLCVYGAS